MKVTASSLGLEGGWKSPAVVRALSHDNDNVESKGPQTSTICNSGLLISGHSRTSRLEVANIPITTRNAWMQVQQERSLLEMEYWQMVLLLWALRY